MALSITHVSITPTNDGPYLAKGTARLAWPNGNSIPVAEEAYFRRRGQSGTKPICGGSRVRIGFRFRGRDATDR